MRIIKVIRSTLIVAILIIAVVALLMFGAFKGTYVYFQSSDGEWADSEVPIKDRGFYEILVGFELYRIKCAPTVELQRTTSRPEWYEYDNLFNDYSEPKWKVPYAKPLPKTASGYYPPISAKHCANGSITEQEMRVAGEQAKQYMHALMP